MVTTKPAPSDKTLRHMPVPTQWAGIPGLWPLAWLAFTSAVVLAAWAFTQGDLQLEVVAVALGTWAFFLLAWLGRPTLRVGPTGPLGALLVWTILCCAAGWWQGWTVPTIALGTATVATIALGARILRRRARLARTMVWLAEGLGPATSDNRAPTTMLRPTWRSLYGLPVAWHYPPSLTPSEKRVSELESIASARLGIDVKINWQTGRAILEQRPDRAEPTDEDPVIARLNEVLEPMIPGARITSLTRDEDGRPNHVTFTWPAKRTVRVTPMPYRARVARALQTALGFPITVRWEIEADCAHVAPVVPLPDAIAHPPRDEAQPMKAAFGQFRGGNTAVWDLNSTLPHVLIVGGTGGGKTVLMMTLLTALPQTSDITTDVYVIDPKRVGFKGVYGNIPGVNRPATTAAAFVDTLQRVQREMDDRYEALENDHTTRDELKPIVLFIDEGQEMYDVLKTWWVSGEGKEDWKARHGLEKAPTGSEHPAMGMLGSILRLGREARVHVVLASQQAAASWLQTSSRGQFAVRIALRNLSVEDSRMVFGSPIATSGLENTPGRAWVSTGLGAAPEHAQIYWTPKIERGLRDADRAILHGLGVTLPDDASPAAAVAAIDSPSAPTVAELEPPAELEHDGMSHTEPTAGEDLPTTDTPVTAVEDGTQILVDTDTGPALATVETIDPDDVDSDCLAVTYRLADGDLGVVSLRDDETLSVVE